MSFGYVRWNLNPVVGYYYEEGAQKRLAAWRGFLACLVFGVVISGMIINLYSLAQPTYAETPGPVPLVSPAATPVISNPKTNQLQIDIDQWVANHPKSKWGVSVRSMDNTSVSAESNGQQKFSLASLYKLFLLQPLAANVPAETWMTTRISTRSYADCVNVMLRLSDNPCAEAIGAKIGWAKAEKNLRTSGYLQTTFRDKGFASGTAADTSQMLQNLYSGQEFNDSARKFILDAMSTAKKKEAIRLACLDCTVYNKTGDLGTVHNDAAIIQKNGKTYTIVILSEGSTWQEVTELSKLITTHL